MTEASTIPSFGAMLRQALGKAIYADAEDDFLAMCSDDVIFQFPFAPEGTVTEIRGRETLTAYLQAAGTVRPSPWSFPARQPDRKQAPATTRITYLS